MALHRVLFARREKNIVVAYGHAALVAALATVGALLVGVVAFVFDIVLGGAAAVTVGVVAGVVVVVLWIAIPVMLRSRGAGA